MAVDWTVFFAPFCHQMPERTLTFAGRMFPLCARCAGLYLGLAASGGWLLARAFCRRRPWLPASWRVAFGLAFLLTGVDWLTKASDRLPDGGNQMRFVLALGAGAAILAVVTPWLAPFWPDARRGAFRQRAPHGLPLCLAAVALLGLDRWSALPGMILPWLAALGLLTYVAAIAGGAVRGLSNLFRLLFHRPAVLSRSRP